MSAARLRENLVGWLHRKVTEGKVLRAHRPALRMHATSCELRSAPTAVVTHHDQDRQVVHGRHHMTGAGYTEQISPVADDRDHRFLGCAKFDAQRAADTPAQPTGRRKAEIGPGSIKLDVTQAEVVFVDED